MSDDPDKDAVPEAIEIQCYFVRERNALLVRGDFSPLYTDYYLHLMQHGIRHSPELDGMLKDAMAMLTLHLTARPWAETVAPLKPTKPSLAATPKNLLNAQASATR